MFRRLLAMTITLGSAAVLSAVTTEPTVAVVPSLIEFALTDGNCRECNDCGAGHGHALDDLTGGAGYVGKHECQGEDRTCDSTHGTCGGIGGGEPAPEENLLPRFDRIEFVSSTEASRIVAASAGRAWINSERRALQFVGCSPGSVALSIPIDVVDVD